MKHAGFRWSGQVSLLLAMLVVLQATGGGTAPAAVDSQAALPLSAALPPLPVYEVDTLRNVRETSELPEDP